MFLASRAHLRWQRALDLEAVYGPGATPATYDAWLAYGRSKTCNILCARALAARFPFAEGGVSFNALHPGLVNTGLLAKAGLGASTVASAISVEEGAATAVMLAAALELRGVSGKYFADEAVVKPPEISTWASSDAEADALWHASLRFAGFRTAEDYGKAQ